MLKSSFAFHRDQKKLVEMAALARKELEDLFERDAADNITGWSPRAQGVRFGHPNSRERAKKKPGTFRFRAPLVAGARYSIYRTFSFRSESKSR